MNVKNKHVFQITTCQIPKTVLSSLTNGKTERGNEDCVLYLSMTSKIGVFGDKWTHLRVWLHLKNIICVKQYLLANASSHKLRQHLTNFFGFVCFTAQNLSFLSLTVFVGLCSYLFSMCQWIQLASHTFKLFLVLRGLKQHSFSLHPAKVQLQFFFYLITTQKRCYSFSPQ